MCAILIMLLSGTQPHKEQQKMNEPTTSAEILIDDSTRSVYEYPLANILLQEPWYRCAWRAVLWVYLPIVLFLTIYALVIAASLCLLMASVAAWGGLL